VGYPKRLAEVCRGTRQKSNSKGKWFRIFEMANGKPFEFCHLPFELLRKRAVILSEAKNPALVRDEARTKKSERDSSLRSE
jgi:hypothetical protein